VLKEAFEESTVGATACITLAFGVSPAMILRHQLQNNITEQN
jgi:hypothetical protein